MERSKKDNNLPRYYKGYDVDILLDKIDTNTLSKEEESIMLEVYTDCYSEIFNKRNRMFIEEYLKVKDIGFNPTIIEPVRPIPNRSMTEAIQKAYELEYKRNGGNHNEKETTRNGQQIHQPGATA